MINPRAGVGSARRMKELVLDRLKGADVRTWTVKRGEDITEVVADAVAGGATDVVAVGGDGTVSAVAGALAGRDANLGIIPTGTANMMARELGIPLTVTGSSRLLLEGHRTVNIDVLDAGSKRFIYQVVIGSGSEAVSRVSRAEKRLLGRTVYALAGLWLLTDYYPIKLSGRIDGQELRMWANQVGIANAGILGLYPFRLGRGIHMDDGKVEVIAMRGRGRLRFLNSGFDLMLGNYERSRGLRYYDARSEIFLDTDPSSIIKADGEIVGRTPLHLKVMPGAVRVLVPARRGDGAGTPPDKKLFHNQASLW